MQQHVHEKRKLQRKLHRTKPQDLVILGSLNNFYLALLEMLVNFVCNFVVGLYIFLNSLHFFQLTNRLKHSLSLAIPLFH